VRYPSIHEAFDFDMSKHNTKHRSGSRGKEPTTLVTSPHPDANEPNRRLPEGHAAPPEIQIHLSHLGPLLSHRPLVLGEDERLYDELLTNVTRSVKPQDLIEAIWVKDVVDEIWDAQRYRRLKASLLRTAAKEHLGGILRTAKNPETERFLTPDDANLLTICCMQGDEESVEEVKDILTDYALDLDSIMSQALADQLETIERIDRLIASADARRNKALSSVDRRRETFARQLRRVAEDLANDPDPTPVELP
jgi:hypothetical protein